MLFGVLKHFLISYMSLMYVNIMQVNNKTLIFVNCSKEQHRVAVVFIFLSFSECPATSDIIYFGLLFLSSSWNIQDYVRYLFFLVLKGSLRFLSVVYPIGFPLCVMWISSTGLASIDECFCSVMWVLRDMFKFTIILPQSPIFGLF